MAERPEVDLTGGKYDEFETLLSKKIGLKVILLRDWQTPDSYYSAKANISFAASGGSQEKYDAAKSAFAKVEAGVLASMRANLADRDPQVGHDLSDNDLRSLQAVGHITLRHGNAEREQAVVIYDPGYNRFPEENPVLRFALTESFENAWDIFGDNRHLKITDFLENFEMSAEDKRRYQGVMNVRYALQNQSEYNDKDKGWYYEPFYYNFAQLSDREKGMWKSAFELPFAEVVKKLELERYWDPEDMGIKDPEFFDKLKMAGAIMNLRYSILDTHPNDTFARLGLESQVTPIQVVEIQRGLRSALQDKFKEYRAGAEHDYGMDSHGLDDFRILFPLFREVYEADKSQGPQRQYLDTIMAGLQKWFPTLTNGPVPDVKAGSPEPPRSLPQAGPVPAEAPKPGPAGTPSP